MQNDPGFNAFLNEFLSGQDHVLGHEMPLTSLHEVSEQLDLQTAGQAVLHSTGCGIRPTNAQASIYASQALPLGIKIDMAHEDASGCNCGTASQLLGQEAGHILPDTLKLQAEFPSLASAFLASSHCQDAMVQSELAQKQQQLLDHKACTYVLPYAEAPPQVGRLVQEQLVSMGSAPLMALPGMQSGAASVRVSGSHSPGGSSFVGMFGSAGPNAQQDLARWPGCWSGSEPQRSFPGEASGTSSQQAASSGPGLLAANMHGASLHAGGPHGDSGSQAPTASGGSLARPARHLPGQLRSLSDLPGSLLGAVQLQGQREQAWEQAAANANILGLGTRDGSRAPQKRGRKPVGFRVTPKGIMLTRSERDKQSIGSLERQVYEKQASLNALQAENTRLLTRMQLLELATGGQQVALTLIAQEDRRGIPSKHAHSSSHSSGSSSGSSSCSEAVLQEGSTNDGSTISRSMLVDKLGLPAVLGGVDMHDLLWARSVTLEAFMEWWGAYVGTVSAALLACHEADICGRAQLCEAETKLSVTIVHGLSRLGLLGLCQPTLILQVKGVNMETRDCTPLPETFWESVVARMDVQLSQCDEAHTLFAVYCQLHNDLVDELKQAQLDLRNLIGSAPPVYTERMFHSCNPRSLTQMTGQLSVLKRMRAAMQKTHILYNSATIIAANRILMPRGFAKCIVYSWPYLPCGASCMKVCESMRMQAK